MERWIILLYVHMILSLLWWSRKVAVSVVIRSFTIRSSYGSKKGRKRCWKEITAYCNILLLNRIAYLPNCKTPKSLLIFKSQKQCYIILIDLSDSLKINLCSTSVNGLPFSLCKIRLIFEVSEESDVLVSLTASELCYNTHILKFRYFLNLI